MTHLSADEVRARGFEWPGPVGALAVTATDGVVDLVASREAVERTLGFAERDEREIHAFRDKWAADWNDVTDRRGEYASRVAMLRQALRHIDDIMISV